MKLRVASGECAKEEWFDAFLEGLRDSVGYAGLRSAGFLVVECYESDSLSESVEL